jgi:dynein heavy chain 1
MSALVDRMFTPDCYSDEFRLVNPNGMETSEPVTIAEAGKCTKAEFEEWLGGLSTRSENPQWLGLPETADGLLKAKEAHDALNGLLSMTSVHSEDDAEKEGAAQRQGTGDALPGWMRSLQGSVDRWSNQMD